MNNLKKSIIIFTAISSISVVSAMASSDARGNLEDWYEKEYQESVQDTSQIMADGVNEIKSSIEDDQLKDVPFITSIIDSYYQRTIKDSKNDLENYQKSYLSRLNETQTKLGEVKLDDITEEKVRTIEDDLTIEVENILQDILEE